MQQKTDEDVKSVVFNQNMKRGTTEQIASIKQENEDTKESLKCALYSPVKLEAPSLEINKYESFKLHKMILPNVYSEPDNFDSKSLYCKSLTYYRTHLFKYHRIKSGPTESSTRVNRNGLPVIDEINNHCTACDRTYANRITYKSHLYGIHGITLPRLKRTALKINRDIIPDMNDKKNHCAS
ncbi:hypothetical protein HPULCUR_010265 [Helicostylum pulchrum]|uniref:C2H2-type domain-containing protein n=1 Tax=Helicostylum pulchrum TaxID=562976 RepID=A0ABP9YDT4_9FUNG